MSFIFEAITNASSTTMAYNSNNKLKQFRHILDVYNQVKQEDIPDTYIVHKVFPKHNIFICYRKWMYIKGMKPSELNPTNQLNLFS